MVEFAPSYPNALTAIDHAGRVRVAWTGADASGLLARGARLKPGAPARIQTLGRGATGALAVDARGRALLLWSNSNWRVHGTRVLASTAMSGRPFAASPEIVDEGAPVIPPNSIAGGAADVGFDPRSGRVLAVWLTGDRANPGLVDAWRTRWAVRRDR
jgi:hypothetical protein